MPEEYKGVFAGDIVCPSDFNYCMECKYGYDDFELCSFFMKPHPKVDEWLEKVQRDAKGIHKKPMLCWRKPRQPWLAFIQPEWADKEGIQTSGQPFMRYNKDWLVIALERLLKLGDDYWFKK